MKKIICLLIGLMAVNIHANEDTKPVTVECQELKNLAREKIFFSDLLPAVDNNSSYFNDLRKKMSFWVTTIVKSDFIIPEIEKKLIFSKDIKKFEVSNKEKTVFSRVIGDYIVANYKIDSYDVLLQENGISFSLRILIANPSNVEDPEDFIKKCIWRFTNFSYKEKDFDFVLTKGKEITYGEIVSKDTNPFKWWWQKAYVCILNNGTMFFIAFHERNGKVPSPQARAGLPDRF